MGAPGDVTDHPGYAFGQTEPFRDPAVTAIPRRGRGLPIPLFRVAGQRQSGTASADPLAQEIRFCDVDGARVAYATVGDGPALLLPALWISHLELEWGSTSSARSSRRWRGGGR